MSESLPAFIGVAPDGSGKSVRNVELDVLQDDGTTVTTLMQVVVLADAEGRLLPPPGDWQSAVLGELRRGNELLGAILEALTG